MSQGALRRFAALALFVVVPALASAQTGIPFQQSLSCDIPDGANQCTAHLKVPDGNILVTQTISLSRAGSNPSLETAFLNAFYQNKQAGFYLFTVADSDNFSHPAATTDLTIYVQAGNKSNVTIYRDSSAGAETNAIVVSGYLR